MITEQHLRAGFAIFDAAGMNQPQAWKRLEPEHIESTWCAVLADVTPEEFQAAVLLLVRDGRSWYPTAGIINETVQKRIRAVRQEPAHKTFQRIRSVSHVVPYNVLHINGKPIQPETYWQMRLDQEFGGQVPENIQNAIDRLGGLNFFRSVRDDEIVWRLRDFDTELQSTTQLQQVTDAQRLLLG